MRYVVASALLIGLVAPVRGELSREELEQIGQVVERELRPVRKEMSKLEMSMAEMRGEVKAARGELEGVKGKLEGIRENMVTKDMFMELQGRAARLEGKAATKDVMLLMWVSIILAIFGIPYLYGRSDRQRVRDLDREVRDLRSEVDRLPA
ncbi:MAG: hypothetical protein DRP95_06825 [Candidatus Latescibacterota bacterium]|nr:MAG: hypothetical protein DRP95_06825 [Candidatus Latescibacterota bacterium]